MNVTKIFVGVDISKDHLDVHLRPINQYFRVENNAEGLNKIDEILSKHSVDRVVCEASGGYEFLLIRTLSKLNYRVWLMEPKRIKSFIASEGIKAKTDKIDAAMIALFAQQKELPDHTRVQIATLNAESLQALVKRKEVVTKTLIQEKTRLDHPQASFCKDEIESSINFLADQIKSLDGKIESLIKSDDEMLHRQKIITSIPGAGKGLSSTLIALMPELGTIEDKSIAALVGVVPYTSESGKFKKTSTIREGRPMPRKSLYMPTLSGIQCNPDFKTFYNRLLKKGKKPKVALIAVMRKFIVLVNVLLRENRTWEPNKNGYSA